MENGDMCVGMKIERRGKGTGTSGFMRMKVKMGIYVEERKRGIYVEESESREGWGRNRDMRIYVDEGEKAD